MYLNFVLHLLHYSILRNILVYRCFRRWEKDAEEMRNISLLALKRPEFARNKNSIMQLAYVRDGLKSKQFKSTHANNADR